MTTRFHFLIFIDFGSAFKITIIIVISSVIINHFFFLNQRAFPPLSCLLYSVFDSLFKWTIWVLQTHCVWEKIVDNWGPDLTIHIIYLNIQRLEKTFNVKTKKSERPNIHEIISPERKRFWKEIGSRKYLQTNAWFSFEDNHHVLCRRVIGERLKPQDSSHRLLSVLRPVAL